MQRSERRAVLTLLILALLGHGIRLAATGPGQAPGASAVLLPADSEALEDQRDRVARALRPLAEGETIDLDRAGLSDLVRLPRVGPALAKAIVADRQRRGPFGSLSGLDRVSGIGPGLIETVRPFAVFSGRPAGSSAGPPASPSDGMVDVNRATEAELQRLPGIGPARAAGLVAYRELHGPFATLESLTRVEGIGPGLIDRLRGLALVR
jgi:competence ComEA-like helix-hairpin-helix protein